MPMPDGMIREDADGGVLLKLRVHPGAGRDAVNGIFGDALKIDLRTPPVDGKANAGLIRFLSALLDVPKNGVELKSGECSRSKTVRISGKTPGEIISALKLES